MIVRYRGSVKPRFGTVFSVLVVFAVVLTVTAPVVTAAPAAPATVTVDTGSLRGVVAPDHRLFAGIPYAAPPIGALRWQPPQPAPPWPGVRAAKDSGPTCAQPIGIGGLRSLSEDCLYLDVWTPPTLSGDGHGLPVMVWLHGGGLQTGTGSTYGAAPLVSTPEGDAIVVTINYRLGVLGFLAASALDEGAGAGDYGLMDQQAALRWVQRNIAAFGGDPSRVTVAGESAGGTSICAQLAVPSSAGLFRAAIMQSGLCGSRSLPDAEAAGDAWAAGVGCADGDVAACLRELPASVLVDRAPDEANVVYGNDFLPRDPVVELENGGPQDIPIFIGSNHDETALWVWLDYGNPLGAALTAADYPAALAKRLRDSYSGPLDRVLAQYPVSDYAQPALALVRVWTDSAVCQAIAQVGQFGRRNPTYAYEFDDPAPLAPPSRFPMGAYHGSELVSLFDLARLGPVFHGVMSADQQRLQAEMRRYWMRFVNDGTVDPAGLTAVPRYTANDSALMSFRPSGSVLTTGFAADHRCAFWSAGEP